MYKYMHSVKMARYLQFVFNQTFIFVNELQFAITIRDMTVKSNKTGVRNVGPEKSQ